MSVVFGYAVRDTRPTRPERVQLPKQSLKSLVNQCDALLLGVLRHAAEDSARRIPVLLFTCEQLHKLYAQLDRPKQRE